LTSAAGQHDHHANVLAAVSDPADRRRADRAAGHQPVGDRARIRQLESDLDRAPGVPGVAGVGTEADPFAPGAPLLRLRAVRHRFPGLTENRPFMLGPVDLRIDAGELIFVVGGNGSGKTTLAMPLPGLYEPEDGHIELSGVRVERSNIAHYRQCFSAVFADFHLFDELVDAGGRDVEARVAHYLDVLGLAHKVRVEQDRFSTTSLSSGQRKRMALLSPISKTGRSACSTSGQPIRIPRSSGCSIESCCRSSSAAARP
jgi:ATPase subunit of ABC transporter with duplicated ATPase domains